eukprot:g21355.t1
MQTMDCVFCQFPGEPFLFTIGVCELLSQGIHSVPVCKTLTTRRTDKSTGWAQLVQIKCCDDEAKVEKEHPKFPVPSVVMFYPNDERYAVFDGDLHNFHALDKWINGRKTPSVMRLEPERMQHFGPKYQLSRFQ